MQNRPDSQFQEVQMAWKKIRGEFTLLPARDKEVKPDQITHIFMSELETLFTPYFGERAVRERLAVPADYLSFLTLLQGTWRRGDEYGLYL